MMSPALVVSGLDRSADSGSARAASGLGDVESGFSRIRDLLQAALTDYDIAAIDETSDDSWRVFFRTPSDRDRALSRLRADFPTLALQPLDVADEDWAKRSQENLRAVRVGNIIVAPPWDVPTTIVIQPSTGFGTGHHATTRLCLAALQRLDLADRTVLDVGTGSGVLAIAASRLGAAEVSGIDDDADAIHAAWENLALNPGAQVSLIHGDFRQTKPSPADVVLANLTGGSLIASAEELRRLVAANGRLILSGFMTHEESSVVAAFSAFSVEHRDEEDGWMGVTLK
jgi:ribosomal protein L11 methyltransferase